MGIAGPQPWVDGQGAASPASPSPAAVGEMRLLEQITVTEESGTARAEIILGGLPAAFLTQATAPPPGQTDSCSWGGGSGCVRLGLQWARTGAAETKARQLPRASGWRCQERGRKWFVGSGDEAEAVRCGFCPGNLTHVDGAEAPLPQGAVSAITGPGWAGEGGCALRERPNGASGTQGRPRGPRFPHRRWAEGLWADGSTEANGPEPRRKRAVRALPARRPPGREAGVLPGAPARL